MTLIRQRPGPIVIGVAALVIGLAGWYVARRIAPPGAPSTAGAEESLVPDPAPPDPRLNFPTKFRNAKPDVQYVGDASCAKCHAEICKSYHAHPMGRSAEFIGNSPTIEDYELTAEKPVKVAGYELHVSKNAAGFFHRLSARTVNGNLLPNYTVSGNLAIGSGARGRSYLSVEQGAVWQSPVSWFSSGPRWDFFPGFDPVNGGRWAAHTDCLFCHVDRVEPIPQSLNRYREPLLPTQAAIGCERCHGPGQLHVAERRNGLVTDTVDTSIVNPKHLAPDLRASVCEQCHLQGQERVARRGRDVFEYRPGLPFEQFVTVFVRHPDLVDAKHTGGQFEQIEKSRCYTASAGQLACTTCHDPHRAPGPTSRDGFYRTRCLSCHGTKGCTAPQMERKAAADSCIACHMPRGDSANIVHASVTDHRIARRPGIRALPRNPASDLTPLVAYRTGPHAPSEAERERDLGIVLARLTKKIPPSAMATRAGVGKMAEDRLIDSLATWRGDAQAWTALAVARAARGEEKERLAAANAASRLAPNSEGAIAELGEAALTVGEFDTAVEATTKLLKLNPTAIGPRLTRGIAYIRQHEWKNAEADARWVLARQPLHPQARLYLAVTLHHLGDAAGGRREAETAAGLSASGQEREAILDWYHRETD